MWPRWTQSCPTDQAAYVATCSLWNSWYSSVDDLQRKVCKNVGGLNITHQAVFIATCFHEISLCRWPLGHINLLVNQRGDNTVSNSKWVKMYIFEMLKNVWSTLAGLEPAISGVGNRRLIHLATGPLLSPNQAGSLSTTKISTLGYSAFWDLVCQNLHSKSGVLPVIWERMPRLISSNRNLFKPLRSTS